MKNWRVIGKDQETKAEKKKYCTSCVNFLKIPREKLNLSTINEKYVLYCKATKEKLLGINADWCADYSPKTKSQK
ncbi:MAG: hypothetical protein ACFFCI_02185 [Promethearchaeota archaeon]